MANNELSTSELVGVRVVTPKKKKKDPEATRRVGKVRACVFHPEDKRCVGFIVKRPDLAWMFRRGDVFVAIDGFDTVDGRIVIRDDMASTDKAACKRLGINWDDCVLWVGLPVMCQDGTAFGEVGDVVFDRKTGDVISLKVSQGATTNALLGVRTVPADMIRGFRFGMGAALKMPDLTDEEMEEAVRGAILVDDAVKQIDTDGGLAAKAGEATAVVADKVQGGVEAVKPMVKETAAAAGKAVNKGVYATGRQVGRAKGMFAGFKEEYDKASGKTPKKKAPAKSTAAKGSGGKAATAAAASDETDFVYVDEDGTEIIYLDEAGNELVYVDENGNPIHPEDAESDDYSVVTDDDTVEDFQYVDEDGNEIVYVDEDGNPIVFVDEDGNPVDEDGNPLE